MDMITSFAFRHLQGARHAFQTMNLGRSEFTCGFKSRNIFECRTKIKSREKTVAFAMRSTDLAYYGSRSRSAEALYCRKQRTLENDAGTSPGRRRVQHLPDDIPKMEKLSKKIN